MIEIGLMYLLQALGLVGDVRKRDDAVRVLESTFKHFGRLDILVNAAAGNFLVPSEDLSPNGFRTGCIFRSISLSIAYIS
jgi:NAD(P)-dependent dehydrogenase (short-subunit alcohol dehydrogenase family)